LKTDVNEDELEETPPTYEETVEDNRVEVSTKLVSLFCLILQWKITLVYPKQFKLCDK